jgi:hypothetical protein
VSDQAILIIGMAIGLRAIFECIGVARLFAKYGSDEIYAFSNARRRRENTK